MNDKEFDMILENLHRRALEKKDIKLAKAKAEIDAIDREYGAYYDGVYDAIKAVKAAMQKQEG